MYSRPIRPNELYHHGILGMHWGIRRYQPYPKGYKGKGREVGKAARQQARLERQAAKEEAKATKNLNVGSERLQNRIERANTLADIDYLSKKVGWKNTERAGEAHKQIKDIKEVSREILENDSRTRALGNYTRKVRIADIALTSTTASALAASGAAIVAGIIELPIAAASLPIVGAGAVAKLGYDYYKKTFY